VSNARFPAVIDRTGDVGGNAFEEEPRSLDRVSGDDRSGLLGRDAPARIVVVINVHGPACSSCFRRRLPRRSLVLAKKEVDPVPRLAKRTPESYLPEEFVVLKIARRES